MKVNIISDKKKKTELLIIGFFEKEKFAYVDIDKVLRNSISKAIKAKKFGGEFKQIFSVSSLGLLSAEKIMVVGLGKKKEFNLEKLRRVAGFTAKLAKDSKTSSFTSALIDIDLKGSSIEEKAQAVVEASILSLYKLTMYKSDQKKVHQVKEINFLTKDLSKVKNGLKKGQILAESTNYVRDLVNMPACVVTPTYLASEAKKIAKKYHLKLTVLGRKELKKKGMRAILAVGQGSVEEQKMIMFQTNPKAKKKIALVGKGVTFDSGGLDIKPWPYMKDMKCDMAGAAAVMGTVLAAVRLKLPINIIGVMGCVENMPGASAQKAGDIVESYMGKTIEVQNTDAEGRMVLADAVAYAEEQKPDAIVDIATLTGASIHALGYVVAALVSNNDKVKNFLKKASETSGEMIWELPLIDEFRDAVKGEVGDIINLGKKSAGAGVITGATFIEAFIKNTPWAHIDIGGAGWQVEDKEYVFKGGTGFGVRLFISFLENWK